MPDADAADYPDLERMLSVEPARMTHPAEAHLALARHQVAAYRAGRYGPGMAGGRLWVAQVTHDGVRVEVLADLVEAAHPPYRSRNPNDRSEDAS